MKLVLLQLDIILRSLGATSYIVGGYVRDSLLGLPSKDIDIVTDADYGKMAIAFRLAGWITKEIGRQYLVLNISKQGHNFELSNFRADTGNTGGMVGCINTDAYRRDFTINSLYSNFNMDTIIDPTGQGLQDIKDRCLRFIGRPATRILEDPLRVIRFYRILHTKHLIPHPASLRAVRHHYNDAHTNTAPERWRVEIERIIQL